MLIKPSDLLLAAEGVPQAAGKAKSDGKKSGKHLFLSENSEPTERGINMFPTIGDFPGFSAVIIGRMPPPGPMPGHDAPEKHDSEVEFLIHLGNNLEDPLDLGAEIELSIGPEKERHTIDKSAMLYVPADTVHGPFKVTKASKQFNFLEIVAGPEMPGAVYG